MKKDFTKKGLCMIKIILSVALIAVVFSGCVGTLVATNNVKDSKTTTVLNAKTSTVNDLNVTKEETNTTNPINKKMEIIKKGAENKSSLTQ